MKKIKELNINYKVVIMVVISVIGILYRFDFIECGGGDYSGFLSKWCQYLRDNGGFDGFASVNTDYNAIYLYYLSFITYIPIKDLFLIKFLSFIFDYVLAFGVYKLTKELTKNKSEMIPIIGFSIIVLMPTVILNSGKWVQCDSIYVAFLCWSLYFMIRKKYNMCFIFFGIAITFKLQAIFLLPAYGIIYFKNRDFSILKGLWVPLVNFILYIPAIFLGKPITSLYDAYFTQVDHYSYKTVLGYPNLYNFSDVTNTWLIKPGIIFTMVLLLILLIFVLRTKGKLDNNQIIHLCVLVLFLVPFFLPEMHDRYGYAAETLCAVYFLIMRKDYIVFIMVNINSILTYHMFLCGMHPEYIVLVSISQFLVVLYFAYYFVKMRLNKKMDINCSN